MKRILIHRPWIINEGQRFIGSVLIEDEKIACIYAGNEIPDTTDTEIVEAEGLYLLPGVIDTHVHFRDPGLTHKADIESESRAAAAGGVTSYFDMPNTNPQTTTLEALEEKFKHAAETSRVNYSFYFGATNTNTALLPLLDKSKVCGVKLFMGASTGNMLVDRMDALLDIFNHAGMIITVHCEDSNLINEHANRYKELYGEDPDVSYHPLIRDEEVCWKSSSLAAELAHRTGARLHIAHISTAKELEQLSQGPLSQKQITAEACVSHLFFCDEDYATLGTRIKCNPAIKSRADRGALRMAVTDGRIDVIATDHAPHLLSEKQGGCIKAVSGMPMLQFSLITMLELADHGALSQEQVIEKMCHAPAEMFNIQQRGYIRKGYKADLVLVNKEAWTLQSEQVISKCGWSPLENHTFRWKVCHTWVNGQTVYENHGNKPLLHDEVRGEQLVFDRE